MTIHLGSALPYIRIECSRRIVSFFKTDRTIFGDPIPRKKGVLHRDVAGEIRRSYRALGVETRRLAQRKYYKTAALVGAGSVLGGFAMRLRSGKRYRPSPNRFVRNVRLRGASTTRSARTAPRPRPGIRSGLGVTTQQDARSIYRKRRMPRRRRKAWKRFTRKVHFVAEKDLGTQTVVFNKGVGFQNSNGGSHAVGFVALYSGNSIFDSTLDDLNAISAMPNLGNSTAAAGETVQNSTKYLFHSAVLDVTVRNTSFDSETSALDSFLKMEVDVYEFTSGVDWTDVGTVFQDPTSMFNHGGTVALNIGGAGTGVAVQTRGCTPWDLPYALSRFRVRILKKTKYFLNSGEVFTYQIRDPRRHVISQERIVAMAGPNVPKLTRWLFFVAKLVPGITLGATDYTERLSVGVTRKYMFKMEGVNDDRDRFVSG